MDEKEQASWKQDDNKPNLFRLHVYDEHECAVDLSDRTYHAPHGGWHRVPACDNIFEAAERFCGVAGADYIRGNNDAIDWRAHEETRAGVIRTERSATTDLEDALNHLDRYELLKELSPPGHMVTAQNALSDALESLDYDIDERGWTQRAQDGAAIAAHMLGQTPPAFQNEHHYNALLCAIDAQGQMARAREAQEQALRQAREAARNLVQEADKAVTLMQERGIGMNEAGLSKALYAAHAAGIEPEAQSPSPEQNHPMRYFTEPGLKPVFPDPATTEAERREQTAPLEQWRRDCFGGSYPASSYGDGIPEPDIAALSRGHFATPADALSAFHEGGEKWTAFERDAEPLLRGMDQEVSAELYFDEEAAVGWQERLSMAPAEQAPEKTERAAQDEQPQKKFSVFRDAQEERSRDRGGIDKGDTGREPER